VGLRLLVTSALLGLVAVRANLTGMASSLLGANLLLLICALLCSYAGWGVNAYKWRQLLLALGRRHTLRELYVLNLAALFHGLALPGQVTGEALKAVRLGRRVEHRGTVYLSVFVDRITGLMALALLGIVALVLHPPPTKTQRWVEACVALLVAVVLAGVVGLVLLRMPGRRWKRVLPHWNWLLGRIDRLRVRRTDAEEVAPDLTARALLATLLLGVAFQLSVTATNWLVAKGLGVEIAPFSLAWVVALASIVQMAPISFAGTGPRELTYVGLLGLYGVESATALALSLTILGIQITLGVSGVVMEALWSEAK
jgi:uncharacterized membrane protein YbhN (UPF0104 family)